ncbi:ICE2-domain-containing protein [Atractiella rhizophila]|nr:ICE2-domain-containing protein [Atractiella rhizophila]
MLIRLLSNFLRGITYLQVMTYLPLALDIAGKECCLTLSAALALYSFVSSTLTLLARYTRIYPLIPFLSFVQHISVPIILLVCLNVFSSNSKAAWEQSSWTWFFLRKFVSFYGSVLHHSGPFFVLLEGVSTLLVAQSAGRISSFLTEKGDGWSIVFLVTSASTYVLSTYTLFACFSAAAETALQGAVIGALIVSTLFMTGIAFSIERGNVVETSLMFGYVCYNVFLMSTEASYDPMSYVRSFDKTSAPPLPPFIWDSFSAAVTYTSQTFGQGLDFLSLATSALPLPVIISLVYRVGVLFAASRVVLFLKKASDGGKYAVVDLRDEDITSKGITLIVSYSRVVLILVYTNLLVNDDDGASHNWWRWANVILTLVIWFADMIVPRDGDSGWSIKDD